MQTKQVAVYSTLYPAVAPYLRDWYNSVHAQTDEGFDLWIGLDGLSPAQAEGIAGQPIRAFWLSNSRNDSVAAFRNVAFELLTDRYEAIIFTDADDLLEPTRVEASRKALQKQDVAGCALRLMDQDGRDIDLELSPPRAFNPEQLLLRHNVFGLSNTAYRADILKRCLPLPGECVLIDWLLATRALSLEARFGFDFVPRMHYRQHPNNMAGVLGPFSGPQLLTATARVLTHYACLLEASWPLSARLRQELTSAQAVVQDFYRSLNASPVRLNAYLNALNQLQPEYIWWWSVAHPELEKTWKN